MLTYNWLNRIFHLSRFFHYSTHFYNINWFQSISSFNRTIIAFYHLVLSIYKFLTYFAWLKWMAGLIFCCKFIKVSIILINNRSYSRDFYFIIWDFYFIFTFFSFSKAHFSMQIYYFLFRSMVLALNTFLNILLYLLYCEFNRLIRIS